MISSRALSLEPLQTPSNDREAAASASRLAPRSTEPKADGRWVETWLRSEEEEIFDLPCTD